MIAVLNKSKRKNILVITLITVLSVAVTVGSGILYALYGADYMLTVFVTFLTVSYHFLMRLAVGQAVTAVYKNRDFNVGSRIFRIHKFEEPLYKFLKIKKRKKNAITAKPEQFDIKTNSLESLLHNSMQAELGHKINMVLSFVPLLLIIPFGAAWVFVLTSFFSCIADLHYVIIQRFNRPRIIKLIQRKKINKI